MIINLYFSMKSVLKALLGFCIGLFIAISFCFDSVEANQVFITTEVELELNQNLTDPNSIDDLLGPDTNFPFDPANHRDRSNPIKRIGKISDDNL